MQGSDADANPFVGYWIAPEDDDSVVYVFASENVFMVLDTIDDQIVGNGTYTYSGSSCVITVSEGAALPNTMNASIVSENELVIEYDGEQIIMSRISTSDEEFSSYQESQGSDPDESSNRTYTAEEGGKIRFRDFGKGLWASYPDSMNVSEDYFFNAILVYDGMGGYVTYRDLTEEYSEFSGSDDEFMGHYMENYVLSDYDSIFENDGLDYTNYELIDSSAEGRLSTAEVNIYSTNYDVQVRCLIYTATYDDGKVRVMIKAMFADYDDANHMQTLSDDVRGGACR